MLLQLLLSLWLRCRSWCGCCCCWPECVKMGVCLLLLLLLLFPVLPSNGALQAMTHPALWSPLAAAPPPAPGLVPAPHCSSLGSLMTSAASLQARAATAPYTCRLWRRRGEKENHIRTSRELVKWTEVYHFIHWSCVNSTDFVIGSSQSLQIFRFIKTSFQLLSHKLSWSPRILHRSPAINAPQHSTATCLFHCESSVPWVKCLSLPSTCGLKSHLVAMQTNHWKLHSLK